VELRRVIREWWLEGPDGVRKARALQGRTLVLKDDGDGTTVDGAAGAPASETRRQRLRILGRLLQLPPGELAPGGDRPLEPIALEEAFGGDAGWNGIVVQEATGIGRLAGVEEGGVARIRLDVAVEGPLAVLPDVRARVGLATDVRLRLSDGRPLGVAASGNGSLDGFVARDAENAV
jgi:hypothetical protein